MMMLAVQQLAISLVPAFEQLLHGRREYLSLLQRLPEMSLHRRTTDSEITSAAMAHSHRRTRST